MFDKVFKQVLVTLMLLGVLSASGAPSDLTFVGGPYHIKNKDTGRYLYLTSNTYAGDGWITYHEVKGDNNYNTGNPNDLYLWYVYKDANYYYIVNKSDEEILTFRNRDQFDTDNKKVYAGEWKGASNRKYYALKMTNTGEFSNNSFTSNLQVQRGTEGSINHYMYGKADEFVYWEMNDGSNQSNMDWVFEKVNVTETAPTDINVTVASSLTVGASIQAVAVVSPSDAFQSVTWSSSNTSVATVDAYGKITAHSTGTFTVSATSVVDGTVKGTSQTITVSAAPSLVCNNALGIVQIEDESPKINDLVEDVWAKAPRSSINNVISGSGNPSNAGSWRALYDSQNLYLLVEITDPDKHGTNSWDGDGIEIYIDGNGNGGNNGYGDADDAAIKFSFSGSSASATGSAISGNKFSDYKMYDTANGYALEVSIPWSNIGGYPANGRNMKIGVVNNQANSNSGRISIVASNANNSNVYEQLNSLGQNVTFCRTTDINISGNNTGMSCMGDLVEMTIDGLPGGVTPVWRVYDTKTSSWKNDENAKLIDGKWVLLADNNKHRVEYVSGGKIYKSNTYALSAATCCSSEVDSYVLWEQTFGTLDGNCSRKDFDSDWNVTINGMNYSNGFVDDSQYAIVANPGCGEFGNNGGEDRWFYSGEDHTPGDTNGGMLLVNNGARQSVVFSQYVESPCDNATVDFSAWFANVCRAQGNCGLPVNLTFKVSGQTEGGVWEDVDISNMSTGDIPWQNSLTWKQRNTSFNTQKYKQLYIQVINLGTSGQGNDVAIDDFRFVSCAPILNLYADINTYAKIAIACKDTLVTLVPRAPTALEELYQPLYYMLQKYDDAAGKWVSASGISTPQSNPLPSWPVDTRDLPVGVHRYRVVMGNNASNVEIVANGGKPIADNCILYTITDEALIEKSTLDVSDDALDMKMCEGQSFELKPETARSDSKSWTWKLGETVICSGTKDNPNSCDKDKTFVAGNTITQYSYTAEDEFGCKETVNYTVTPSSPKYKFTQDDEICEGEKTTLKMEFTDATAPYKFKFSDGTSEQNIETSNNPWTKEVTPTATTTYSVRMVEDKNCKMKEK